MFRLPDPYTGGLPFLITPERGIEEAAGAGNGKRGFTLKGIKLRGFCTWAFKLDHLKLVKLILFKKCSAFLTFIHWGLPFLITPEGGRAEATGAGNGKRGFTQK